MSDSMHDDIDPLETGEWLQALDSVMQQEGRERAAFLIERLIERAGRRAVKLPSAVTTPYRNTIAVQDEARIPGNIFMDRRIRSLIRWNAFAMVMRANQTDHDLGGHISSFASSATLYEIGFGYFFRGTNAQQLGDLIYFQGHSAPGIYARSFLEGRLDETRLDNFRQEVAGHGLSSYPHPWLMPDYWQFPTVSMGLGPIQAIYQAHFLRYLENRGLLPASGRKVWCFLGDGECDEPEALGAIALAGREKLDNLIFVINCNLQRLDGPVRGNGKIIQELEGQFTGANWNVIKVVWGSLWDPLFAKDSDGLLQRRMDEVVDGEFQNYKAKGGGYTREHFFGKSPELLKMVEHLSDADIYRLNRGGHDPRKVYAAYAQAVAHAGQPTVILAKTIKGYGFGTAVESQNYTHSVKKLDQENMRAFRDRFDIPLSDEQLQEIPFYRPSADSQEALYLAQQRERLGGHLPQRHAEVERLATPALELFATQLKGSGTREISTTMAFVRMLGSLMKDPEIGARIVPIVPDEARTFGMEGMFPQFGIYAAQGQLYRPVDADQAMGYREDQKGQILEEGITEAGAMAAWIAAATSYSSNRLSMIPFFIFYSMFGLQRVGDLVWAAGDIQARGFLIGATSGRTTLNGEGLQHQDGHSHLLASTLPNCVAYDPAYAYELALIIRHGIEQMYGEGRNCFYYLTVLNENLPQPALPEGVEEGVIRGIYLLKELQPTQQPARGEIQLLGSGAILREVEAAATILVEEYRLAVRLFSVTSFNELRRDGLEVSRWNRLHPEAEPRQSHVEQLLGQWQAPVVAATDYLKSVADQIREFVPGCYRTLGTDGFGRSDSRAQLRRFFEVDRHHVVVTALKALADEGVVAAAEVSAAIVRFGIDADRPIATRL